MQPSVDSCTGVDFASTQTNHLVFCKAVCTPAVWPSYGSVPLAACLQACARCCDMDQCRLWLEWVSLLCSLPYEVSTQMQLQQQASLACSTLLQPASCCTASTAPSPQPTALLPCSPLNPVTSTPLQASACPQPQLPCQGQGGPSGARGRGDIIFVGMPGLGAPQQVGVHRPYVYARAWCPPAGGCLLSSCVCQGLVWCPICPSACRRLLLLEGLACMEVTVGMKADVGVNVELCMEDLELLAGFQGGWRCGLGCMGINGMWGCDKDPGNNNDNDNNNNAVCTRTCSTTGAMVTALYACTHARAHTHTHRHACMQQQQPAIGLSRLQATGCLVACLATRKLACPSCNISATVAEPLCAFVCACLLPRPQQ